jgi:hypothetical protein
MRGMKWGRLRGSSMGRKKRRRRSMTWIRIWN